MSYPWNGSNNSKNLIRLGRIDQLRREGPVGQMIVSVLSVQKTTPEELINTLMSEPYNLAATEENLAEITRIINLPMLFEIKFERERGCFIVRTVLSI